MSAKVLGFKMHVKDATLQGAHLADLGYPTQISGAEIKAQGGVPEGYRFTLDVTPIVERDGKPYEVQTGDPENAEFDATPGTLAVSPEGFGVSQNYAGNAAGFIPQVKTHDGDAGTTATCTWTHTASGLTVVETVPIIARKPLAEIGRHADPSVNDGHVKREKREAGE